MAHKVHSYGVNGQKGEIICFHCPGCGYDHPFNVGGDPAVHPQWTFNGDYEKPTFAPSLVCNPQSPENRCHSFVRDGRIEFLNDCHHNLRGQTVDLPDWD